MDHADDRCPAVRQQGQHVRVGKLVQVDDVGLELRQRQPYAAGAGGLIKRDPVRERLAPLGLVAAMAAAVREAERVPPLPEGLGRRQDVHLRAAQGPDPFMYV